MPGSYPDPRAYAEIALHALEEAYEESQNSHAGSLILTAIDALSRLKEEMKSVRKADLLITMETTEQALEACDLFFQYYRENANYLERTYDFCERLGIEKIRMETVYAPEEDRKKLLERLARPKALAKDAWLERETPVHPTQFVQIQPMEIQPA